MVCPTIYKTIGDLKVFCKNNVDHNLPFAAKTIGDLKVFCKNDVDHDLLFAVNFQDFLRICSW